MCIYNDTCIYVNYFDVCMGAYAYCKHEYDVYISDFIILRSEVQDLYYEACC